MKKLIIILFIITVNFSLAANTIPRQKFYLSGLVKKNAPTTLTILDFEKFKNQKEFDLFDPYNKNIKTHFYNITLLDLVNTYAAPETTLVKIGAIDGYKVDIKVSEIKSLNLYLAYKDDKGYLTVDRMGPARIIENRVGLIEKDLLTKIGVNWVWQIKTIEFKK